MLLLKTLGADLTYDVNFQYGGGQCKEMRHINGKPYIKIKCWRSNSLQDGCLV